MADTIDDAGKILIPVKDSGEHVEVPIDALPEDVNDIIQVLQGELAPIEVWLRCAVEYYRQGHPESFQKILEPLVELYEQQEGGTSALYHEFSDGQPATIERVKEQLLNVLNALAAYHTVLGSRERDKSKKKKEFDAAKRHYDLAEALDELKGHTTVGPAILHLAKGELSRGEQKLKMIEAFNRNSVPAMLGQACAKFNGGNYRDALKLYREVFKHNPSPPPTVRLGLAYCYHKLGQTRMAQRALERTLQLQEDCVDAMVGIAVIHLNEERVEEALTILKRAYELEPQNPSVLNHLASHYFYRGNYEMALTLSKRAHENSDGQAKAIQAESCYHMARSYHAQGENGKALQWYTVAHKTNPEYLAPQFGLGQMYLMNKEDKKAVACFERVIRAQPTNVEALKVLGYLYAKDGRDTDALAKLNLATEHAPTDASVWLELGKLQQRLPGQLVAALKAYEKAAGILKAQMRTVPAELWNNLGAIRHRLGKLDSAGKAYEYAISVATMKGGADEYGPECISTQYNLGRLYEDRGEAELAIEKYKGILARHPNYPEAFLRLAACEEAAGRPQEAIGWAQKALLMHPRSADAYCTVGNLFLAVDDLKKAEQHFKLVHSLDKCDKDSYASIQLGSIQIRQAAAKNKPHEALMQLCMHTHDDKSKARKEGEEKVDKAAEIFRGVLVHEPNNLYAANGLGVCCVAKGRLHEARQIFTQVREASAACEHATVNLAQIDAILQEHATASSLYDSAAKKATGTRQAMLRMLQARSHFDSGKLRECCSVLRAVVCAQPGWQVAWHNLGLAYLQSARHPDHKAYADSIDAPPPRSVGEVEIARRDLARAHAIFTGASENAELLADAAQPESVADEGIQEGAGKSAAALVLGQKLLGVDSEIASLASSCGLTKERRENALKACEKARRELEEEAERAAEQESRFRQEQAIADAKEAEYAKAREAKVAEEAAAKAAEEEEHTRRIAEQKAKLAMKLEAWREADAREAEAEKTKGAKRRRKEEGEADASDDERARQAVGADDEPEEEAADDDDDDDDDDLFGSDDASSSADDGDVIEEGDEGEDAKAARKAAKLEAKQKRKEEKRAARKAEKKAKKAAEKAARKAAKAAARAEDDLFGSDDDGAPGASAADGAAGGSREGGGRLTKRRKVVDDDEAMDDGEAAAELFGDDDADADVDLFGDDDEQAGGAVDGAAGGASASAAPRKRKAVVVDDDDEED